MAEQLLPGPLQPTSLVIFGITGDLAKRKVLPALYHLIKDNLLPEQMALIGTSRRELSIDELLSDVELCVLETDKVCDPEALRQFRERLRVVQLDPVNGADYERLASLLDEIETEQGVCMNRLYYLSIPPQVYGPIVRQLGEHGLNGSCRHGTAASRLLIEKPFGYDLASAEALIVETAEHFQEDQLFRIDHYLAKETAQNILTFRHHNPLFADVWDHNHIQSLAITAAEHIGIEGRANFYEQVGALRDLIQSHLLQLLSLTTMELPAEGDSAKAIHTAKQQLLASIEPIDASGGAVMRAQYDGYRDEVGNAESTTETYVSLQLAIDNDRWRGVPITLTTGKALAAKRTDITICFGAMHEEPNKLTFRLQPNEGIDIELRVKKPGYEHRLQTAAMDFSYHQAFDDHGHPDAYERVLVDAVRGDRTLFATSEEVRLSWRILQPVLDAWSQSSDDLQFYAVGSTGPVTE